MITNWQLYFSRPNKKIIFFSSVFVSVLTLIAFMHFLTFNENRAGHTFNDPVLNLFHPVPLSMFIFFVMYVFSIYGMFVAFRDPSLFVRLVQAYTLMTLARMLCIYLVPLEAPAAIIPLKDSLLENSVYAGRENLKDLFFSGHTATLFVFCFVFRKKALKWVFGIAGGIVGVLVVLQHVHYSIDVIAAPLFAYLSVMIQRKINLQ
ncbi:MAG: phosphatase PAP2-related protein [Bacteroidia bacterium]